MPGADRQLVVWAGPSALLMSVLACCRQSSAGSRGRHPWTGRGRYDALKFG